MKIWERTVITQSGHLGDKTLVGGDQEETIKYQSIGPSTFLWYPSIRFAK